MKKFLHNVVQRIKSMRRGRTETGYQLIWDDNGVRVEWFSTEKNRGVLAFSWDSVLAVDTFKRDLFHVDRICLAFQTPEGWIEVNEDMKGWSDFLAALQSHLPGFPSLAGWIGKVMFPAYETKYTRLWEKESATQNRVGQPTSAPPRSSEPT